MPEFMERHLAIVLEKEMYFSQLVRKELEESKEISRLMNTLPVRPADPSEYAEWCRGYLKKGGEITHHYGYDMPSYVKMALRSFDLPHNAYGAHSIGVIVPDGLDVSIGGHCSLFYMDCYRALGHYVPMYNDVAALL